MRNPVKRGGIRTWLLWAAVISGYFFATSTSIIVGTALLLLSIPVQFWSKGCLHRNRIVTKSGPYRFVRHPFYSANLLLDGGIVIMSGFWPLMLVFPFWWALAYVPVMREEEGHLTGLFGDEYRDYAARVARVIPWRKPLPAIAGAGFSWRNKNIINQEIERGLRYLTYPLMFFLILRWQEAGNEFLQAASYPEVIAAAGIVLLHLAATLWKKYAAPRIRHDSAMTAG